MIAIIRNIKLHRIILITVICFSTKYLYCANVHQQIVECSNKIIDNKVQIKLIEAYIENLKTSYKKKLILLYNKQKEFSTSITMLYKLKNKPKEVLLLKNLTPKASITTFILIEFLIKSATSNIQKTSSDLESIKNITNELTRSKLQLINLNQQLIKVQKNLNFLITKNQENKFTIKEITSLRSLLKYNTAIATKNYEIFNKINKPPLTNLEKELDKLFIKENKGTMISPSKGYVYSTYQNSKYYNLTYYGIVYIANSLDNIIVPADGEIIFCDTLGKYNNVIIIKHSPSYASIISGDFLENVKLSQKVKKYDILGKTKNYTTPIYFELNYNSTPINPSNWLINNITGE